MAKKVQLMTNAKEWQTVNGVEVLVDVPQEDLDPITDSSCVEIEGHRTLEETINQENMFTPQITETKVHSKVGGVYHDNVVDGAYEEAILYGNTQVNLVESETNDTKYIPHSFTSFQGNESKIGNYNSGRTNQVAPLVKGVTMVNLCQETRATILYQHTIAVANHNAKPNTKYTLKCKFTEKNKNAGIMIQSYGYKDGVWGYIEVSKTIQNLGDDVLLTFTTHEQADSIIIYNNPAFCEDTNDSITLDDIMVIEGDVTDLDLPFFKGIRSVELSRPLTNLLHDGIYKTYGSTTQLSYSSGNVTVTANAIGTWQSANFHFTNEDKLKPNTKYIVMWDSLTQTQTSTSSGSIIAVYDTKSGDGNINIGTANSKPECPVLRSIVFDTTGRDASGIVLRIHATLSNSETGTTTVKGLRVFEWDDSLRTLDLQTIGYFSGTKYVSARTLETEGKNLYPYGNINFTPTGASLWCDATGKSGMYGDVAQKSKCRFLLKKGIYCISHGETINVQPNTINLVSDKEEFIVGCKGGNPTPFTLTQDTYCTLRVKTIEANVVTTVTNIQIERGETATTYEAYQSRYYKPRETEEIVLRSLPNGICDTFNLQTGEYVQNICYLTVKNGFTALSNFTTDTHATFAWSLSANNVECKIHTVFYSNYPQVNTYTTDSVEGVAINSAGNQLTMRIAKSKYASYETFNGYITDNPLIIQYELKEPIITKLQTHNRVYSGQTNAPTSMGNNLSALTYYSNNYYLKVGNLSPVPAILEPITTIPYDVRLKPSTLYTVKYNRGGYSNSMSFDLGGSVVEKTNATALGIVPEEFTVRTPAILSHEQLILSGTGYTHNFIVVEGDITGTELPYFEGMKDVKMPIVKNIGKNLFNPNIIGDSGQYIRNDTGSLVKDITSKYTVGYICVKPNTKYYLYVKGLQRVYFLDNNKQWISRTNSLYQGGTQTHTTNTNFTTGSNCHYIQIQYRVDELDLTNATLVEYGDNNPHVEYKENSVYAVQGEYPITSEMIEQGGFSTGNPNSDGSYETTKYGEENANYLKRLRSKDLIPVKSNTTYAFAHSFSKFIYNVYQWNGNKRFIDGTSQKFADGQVETITTTADTQYIHFLMSKDDINQTITVAEYDWSQFHMYELDSTINLRSLPNGVKDELNLLTGEYIQRVGEVVLDGSEEQQWFIGQSSNANLLDFYIHNIIPNALNNGNGISDKFNYINGVWGVNVAGICVNLDKGISMMLPTKYVKTQDLQGCLGWLQQNPITVQYELEEPIISHVRLVSNNQEREVGVKLPNGVCNTYNPSTGITTVRVGKVVLNGSENWDNDKSLFTNTYRFNLTIKDMINLNWVDVVKSKPFTVSNSFPTLDVKENNHNQDTEHLSGWDKQLIVFNIAKTKIKDSSVDAIKTYLASNPITVWYELNYPQIQPDIVLPNGVHDEYNPETGVYTKRVGTTILDGSETWYYDEVQFYTIKSEYHDSEKSAHSNSVVIPNTKGYNIVTGNNYQFFIEHTKLPTSGLTTSDLWRAYLAQNPTQVWYELQTPITYQLTPYFGLPQPYAYEDGYLIHDSAYAETTLPPEFKYKLVANRTGQVMQNSRKLQEHTTRLSNLEALIIEATIESLFNRELQLFELELMDIQLIDLGE